MSPQVFQLLGNAFYRQKDLGNAALWYQRAALFPPPSVEVRQNLERIHTANSNFAYPSGTLQQQIAAWLTNGQWLTASITGLWTLIWCTVLAFLFVRSRALRTMLMTFAALGLIAAVLGGLGWLWRPSYDRIHELLVVTAPNSKTFTAATVTAGSVVEVPAGSQVRMLEDRGSWCYVEIPANRDQESHRGWLPREVLTDLWPYDRGYLE